MFPHQGSIRSGVRCHSATVTQPARLGDRPRPGACADTGSPGVSHPAGCTDAVSCKLPGSCSEGTPAQARGATMQLGPSASGRTELPEHCALHLGRTKRMQPVSEDRIGGLPEVGERKGVSVSGASKRTEPSRSRTASLHTCPLHSPGTALVLQGLLWAGIEAAQH